VLLPNDPRISRARFTHQVRRAVPRTQSDTNENRALGVGWMRLLGPQLRLASGAPPPTRVNSDPRPTHTTTCTDVRGAPPSQMHKSPTLPRPSPAHTLSLPRGARRTSLPHLERCSSAVLRSHFKGALSQSLPSAASPPLRATPP